MEIYYEQQDLVSFGNYLLSEHRRLLFTSHPDLGEKDLEESISKVHESDINEWKYLIETNKTYELFKEKGIDLKESKSFSVEQVKLLFNQLEEERSHFYPEDATTIITTEDFLKSKGIQ